MFKLVVQRLPCAIKAYKGRIPFPTIARYSSTGPNDLIPDSFFDEKLESEREFYDIASALEEGGLTHLTVTKHASSKISKHLLEMQNVFKGEKEPLREYHGSNLLGGFDEEAVEKVFGEDRLPLDHMMDQDEEEDIAYEPLLEDFVPATSEMSHDANHQGLRACPGKLQRRGRSPELGCHKIDLDELTYLDVLTLKTFLSEDGEIEPKKRTGLCSKCQRKVAKAVKAARNFGLLPHIGQFDVTDTTPRLSRMESSHEPSPPDSPVVYSKSVI